MLGLLLLLMIGGGFWLMFWMIWVRGDRGHHMYREANDEKTPILIGFLALLLIAAAVIAWLVKG